jgi:O-antigen/teichoic acid export membrane protein
MTVDDPLVEQHPRSLLKNAVSQVLGRLLLSLGRLLVAMLIVRYLGTERFGEYALVLSFLVIFEWLTDFGQTDIAVRNICQRPEREGAILRALASLKVLQGPLLFVLLPYVLYIADYPSAIVRAAAIGGFGLLFYAGIQVFRTVFKVGMTMERDVLSELGGLAVMLPLTWYACRQQAGVEALIACYMFSRAVFFLLTFLFGRAAFSLSGARVPTADALELLHQALPLGIAGILVAVYDGLAPMMLSKMTDMSAVAQYAAAARYVFPVIIVVQALNSALFPPLAALWRTAPVRFAKLQQTALESSILVGGGLFCAIHAGADFLMRLIGPPLAEAAGLLRLMAWVVLARAVTTAMAPLIIIAGHQGSALWLAVASVLVQIAVLIVLVPSYGVTGAAIGYLGIELVLGVIPVSTIGQYAAGMRVRWSGPVKLVGSAVLAVGICTLLPFSGTLWGGLFGLVFYLALCIISGAISPRQLQAVLDQIIEGRQLAPEPRLVELEKTES